jgi:hypothetical protein
MYTTTMTMLQPEAHVTVKKNRLKLYENKNHYLKDKSNFEIELFNPTSQKVLAKIWINGKPISAAGIVLRPSERVYLERFIDVANKFQFNTFEVDDVKETKSQRESNGLIKVSFFNETNTNWFSTTGTTSTLLLGNGTTFTTTSTGNPYTVNCSTTTSTGLVTSNFINTSAANTFAGPNIRSVETGRVAEGSKSKQDLRKVDGSFSDYSFCNYEYQILPESLKAVYANEIRNYCHECGTRIRKSNWKFCPNCGAEL